MKLFVGLPCYDGKVGVETARSASSARTRQENRVLVLEEALAALSERGRTLSDEQRAVEAERDATLAALPNLPDADANAGRQDGAVALPGHDEAAHSARVFLARRRAGQVVARL